MLTIREVLLNDSKTVRKRVSSKLRQQTNKQDCVSQRVTCIKGQRCHGVYWPYRLLKHFNKKLISYFNTFYSPVLNSGRRVIGRVDPHLLDLFRQSDDAWNHLWCNTNPKSWLCRTNGRACADIFNFSTFWHATGSMLVSVEIYSM